MLRDVKKVTDLEAVFQATPMALIDFAYEAITNNITLSEEMRDCFNKNTNLIERIPQGDLMKKAEMFLELDIFSNSFKAVEGLKIWQVIQFYGEEAVKQARFQ